MPANPSSMTDSSVPTGHSTGVRNAPDLRADVSGVGVGRMGHRVRVALGVLLSTLLIVAGIGATAAQADPSQGQIDSDFSTNLGDGPD